MSPNRNFHLHLVSDSTGETVTSVARACLVQFEGIFVNEHVWSLIRTPGHTAEDISTVVGTPDGIAVLTHLWWNADGPDEDPFAEDMAALRASRERVLALADLIVPGHGAPFEAYHLRHG